MRQTCRAFVPLRLGRILGFAFWDLRFRFASCVWGLDFEFLFCRLAVLPF